MYDITPDHLPIVGPTAQLDGWWQATGWSGRGMLLAPYLCELLAEHLVAGSPPAMLRQFLPDRFSPADAADGSEADYYARYGSGVWSGPSSGNTTSSPSS
jgi:hypothetical protein